MPGRTNGRSAGSLNDVRARWPVQATLAVCRSGAASYPKPPAGALPKWLDGPAPASGSGLPGSEPSSATRAALGAYRRAAPGAGAVRSSSTRHAPSHARRVTASRPGPLASRRQRTRGRAPNRSTLRAAMVRGSEEDHEACGRGRSTRSTSAYTRGCAHGKVSPPRSSAQGHVDRACSSGSRAAHASALVAACCSSGWARRQMLFAAAAIAGEPASPGSFFVKSVESARLSTALETGACLLRSRNGDMTKK